MDTQRLFLLILATVLVLAWIVLAKKYEKIYESMINTIDSEQFKYPELFCVGFALMKFLIEERENGAALNRKEARAVMRHIYTLDRSILIFALSQDALKTKLHEYIAWYRKSENHLNEDTWIIGPDS